MLDRIGQALLEYESIDGKDLLALMRGETLSRAKPEQRVKSSEDIMAERKLSEAAEKAVPAELALPPEPKKV
jgi:hypothetical protein